MVSVLGVFNSVFSVNNYLMLEVIVEGNNVNFFRFWFHENKLAERLGLHFSPVSLAAF